MLDLLNSVQGWLNSTLFGNWGALGVLIAGVGTALVLSRVARLGKL